MEKIISVKNVTKIIKDEKLLDNVSLEIEKGQICGIIGHNGSGKSVLFKHLAGLMIPSEGEITVNNVKVSDGNFPKDVGVILDCTGFLPMYTAYENLKIIASINNTVTDEKIKNVLEEVGLDAASSKKVKTFSKGMKQRLAIAQAIMEDPKILYLDEPMEALDDDMVTKVRKMLKKLNTEKKVTILITSHIKEDIESLCDVVYKIQKGKISKED